MSRRLLLRSVVDQLAIEQRLDDLLQHHRPRRKLDPTSYRRLLRVLHHLALFAPEQLYRPCWPRLDALARVAPVRPIGDFRGADLESLVRHWCVRVRYPLPRFLFALLHDEAACRTAVRVLRHVGMGGSVRNLPASLLPEGFTRRMAHELWLLDDARSWADALRQAQLRALDATGLLDAVRQTPLGSHIHNLPWSTRLFRWLRELGPLEHEEQRLLLRFATTRWRLRQPEPFRLGARRALFEAHWTLTSDRPEHRENNRFPKAPWGGANLEQDGAVWTIRQLKTPLELFIEGRVLSHCVASYARRAARGRSVLFGMRRDGRRRLTIEVSGRSGTLVEALGKANRLPDPEEIRVIQRWAIEAGVRLDPKERIGPP